MLITRLVILALVAWLAIGIAQARSLDPLTAARIALDKGRPAIAHVILQGMTSEEIEDLRLYEFTRARVFMELGRFDIAASLLKQILNREPHLVRVRLELARSFFELGDFDNARRQFDLVLSGQLSANTRLNVLRYLSRIQQVRNWQFGFSLGISEDSNPNRTTDTQIILINGLPFTINNQQDEKSGQGLNYFFNIAYLSHLSNGDALVFGGKLWANDYPSRAFDNQTLEFFPSYRWNLRAGEINLGPIALPRWREGKSLGTDYGASVQGHLRLSSKLRFDASLTRLQHNLSRHYSSTHEGQSTSVSSRFRYFFRPSFSLGFRLGRTGQKFQRDWLNFKKRRQAFEFSYEFPNGLTTYFSSEKAKQKNQAAHPLFQITRADQQYTKVLSVGLRRFSLNGFFPSITFNREKRRSNIAVYNYDRNNTNLTFSRNF